MERHRRLCEDHVAQQQRLLEDFSDVHRRMLQSLDVGGASTAPAPASSLPAGPWSAHYTPRSEAATPPCSPLPATKKEVVMPTAAPEPTPEAQPSQPTALVPKEDGEEGTDAGKEADMVFGRLQRSEEALAWWRRSSGMQTVEDWVMKYKKHPAGWGALLMIHGIPEVCGRLRSKVENYAIYSALFLSMSIALLTDCPDIYVTCKSADAAAASDAAARRLEGDDGGPEWLCQVRKRLYLYGFGIGTALHMLCILLAMSFVNALNEAPRDCDIYRMFSRGKGFFATLKCQRTFAWGCFFDIVAVSTAVTHHLDWEAVIAVVVLIAFTVYSLRRTSGLLFRNASIVNYWREELGGKPDKNDPFDLSIPVSAFQEASRCNQQLFKGSGKLAGGLTGHAGTTKSTSEDIPQATTTPGQHQTGGAAGGKQGSVAVAGIF
mmetsp:Transcript_82422/g.256015  ORF Transcript_82422/g.256015 Transcript_82422/m.256015 type:complete len:434 (-) Transcript_82422:15-1316(-)